MPNSAQTGRLSESDVQRLVQDWYEALDRHDPIESLLPYLVSQGLIMRFPEGTMEGTDGFRDWYETVTHKFFDEVHELKKVAVQHSGPATADVDVVVNWQAHVWNAPEAHSVWIGFDATQTWTVVSDGEGPRIRDYTVNALDAMPGSPSLDEI